MRRRPLDAETLTAIATDAHLSRHRWTRDPQHVIDQLDSDSEIVREAAAFWAGRTEHTPEAAPLVQAVIAWVGADHPAIAVGRERADKPMHRAP